MTADPRQVLGQSGEDAACHELRRRGYAILARRYRTRDGEIDIIARDGRTLVFVEVKARRAARFGSAADAVDGRKRRRLQRLAQEFLVRSRLSMVPCRFDVVAIAMNGQATERVEVYPAAFDVT